MQLDSYDKYDAIPFDIFSDGWLPLTLMFDVFLWSSTSRLQSMYVSPQDYPKAIQIVDSPPCFSTARNNGIIQ